MENCRTQVQPLMPMQKLPVKLLLLLCAFFSTCRGQETTSTASGSSGKLAFLIPNLIEQSVQQAQLGPATQPLIDNILANVSFGSLNSAIAAELSNLPEPSPASAVQYRPDLRLGVPVPFAQSLGPILTERAETLGRNRFFMAFTFQRFQFDREDDLDLRSIHTAFPLTIPAGAVPQLPISISGLVTADAYVSLNISQTTTYFTYGLTDWLDVYYAIPIVTSTLDVQVAGNLQVPSLGFTSTVIPTQWVRGSSTGLGDQTLRMKAQFLNRKAASMAFATEFRLPTGDEFNYHGAGAFGVKPTLIASFSWKSVSPHLNAGYQWNGSSFLASRDASQKQPLPPQASLAAGFDAAVSPRMTAVFDVLDQIVFHGPRAFLSSFEDSGQTYLETTFPNKTRHEMSASAGFKALLLKHPAGALAGQELVLTANAEFRLNRAGLGARVVPLIGLSYIFGGAAPSADQLEQRKDKK
jgi:hypothetical protein